MPLKIVLVVMICIITFPADWSTIAAIYPAQLFVIGFVRVMLGNGSIFP